MLHLGRVVSVAKHTDVVMDGDLHVLVGSASVLAIAAISHGLVCS